MKTAKMKKRIPAGLLAVMLALVLGAGFPALKVYAASGAVYTCTVTPCYRHPVTGVIEDSGGEGSYATGQGMAEGAVYTTGIMEVTESGEYYLTIRMSLMDYTSGHSFWVQNVGDSQWSSPAVGITGTGTDNNGTTADICMQVPSENCVVRAAMYVEPMGRDVVFYFYPSNYSVGNNTDMNSTMISADGGTEGQTGDVSGSSAGQNSALTGGASLSAEASGQDSADENESASGQDAEGGDGGTSEETSADSDAEAISDETEDETANELQSSIVEPAASDLTAGSDDTALDSAQGLSLSTAGESDTDEETGSASANSAVQQILILVVSITIAGLILIGAAAGVVYYFRRNWYRWGGGEDDDE